MNVFANDNASHVSAGIITAVVIFSFVATFSILLASSQSDTTVNSALLTEYLSTSLGLLVCAILFWRFVQQRDKAFLFLSVGFFWTGSIPAIQHLARLAFVQLFPNLVLEIPVLTHSAWFVLSVLILISAKTRSKTVSIRRVPRITLVSLLLTALAICFLNYVTVYVGSKNYLFLHPPLRLESIALILALPFFLISGILYFKRYLNERHALFAWFASASIALACSCTISMLARISGDGLFHLDVVLRLLGFSGFILGLFADKNLIFETERKLRASLETSLVELERSGAEWQAMVENAQVAIVVLDTQGTIVRCNTALANMFNQQTDRVVRQKIESFIHSHSREQFRVQMQRCLEGHDSEFEIELFRQERKGLPVFVTALPYYKHRVKVNGMHLTIVRIDSWRATESRLKDDLAKVEKALQNEQEEYSKRKREWQAEKLAYSSFLRNSDEIMLLLDERGNCIFINKFGQEQTGFEVKSLHRNKLPNFLRDMNQFQRQFGSSVDLTLHGYEEKWRIKNGETILVSWNARLLTDSEGKRLGIAAVGRDVTRQNELENKLDRYDHQMEAVVRERTADFDHKINILCKALNFSDSETVQDDFNILLQRLCKTVCELGYKLAAVQFQDTGQSHSYWAAVLRERKKITPLAIPKMQTLNFEPRTGVGKQISHSYFYISSDIPQPLRRLHSQLLGKGSSVYIDSNVKNLLVIPLMSKSVKGQLFIFDIAKENDSIQANVRLLETLARATTNILYNQRLMAKNEKRIAELEKESQDRIKFLSHISHDLRTPLNTILSLTELLLRRGSAMMTAEQAEQLKTIEHAGDRLLGLVNNILDFIGIGSESKDLVPNYINFAEFLRSRIEAFQPLCVDKKVKIKARVYNGVPDGVFVDEETLSSAVENLLSNAVKFTTVGEITLSATSKQRGKALEIAVKDSGVGIKDEKLKEIFGEFKRLRQTKAKGTGLGLSIVKKAVERLGGEIIVESQEGKGSVFRMIFPLRKVGEVHSIGFGLTGVNRQAVPCRGDSPKHSGRIVATGKRKSTVSDKLILVIDDDTDTHTAMRFLLEDQGYRVHFAGSGSEGLDIARRKKPGLIFMDLTMPDMDGFETTRKLKSMRLLKNVPVIAMTGKPKAEWPKARNAGCVDWLGKPFRAKELAQKLHQWLQVKKR